MQFDLILLGMIGSTVFKYLALVLIVLGFGLRYWIGSRRFNRRNFAGLEQFGSYGRAGLFTLMERIVKVVGALLMIGGVVLFLFFWLGEPTKKKVDVSNSHSLHKKQTIR